MTTPPLPRRLLAEFIGTGMLVTVVVGSGIAASRLSDDPGVQLLATSLATTLGLAVLIAVLAPVSGAHFNPVVSVIDLVEGRRPREAAAYVLAQAAGGISGAMLANAMFGVNTAIATTDRATIPHLLAEVVATAGLVVVVVGLVRARRTAWIPAAVGAYIGAAYWFTSSTAFANPAVTVGRMFSDTFAGIAPVSGLAFIAAQFVGGALGVVLILILFPHARSSASS